MKNKDLYIKKDDPRLLELVEKGILTQEQLDFYDESNIKYLSIIKTPKGKSIDLLSTGGVTVGHFTVDNGKTKLSDKLSSDAMTKAHIWVIDHEGKEYSWFFKLNEDGEVDLKFGADEADVVIEDSYINHSSFYSIPRDGYLIIGICENTPFVQHYNIGHLYSNTIGDENKIDINVRATTLMNPSSIDPELAPSNNVNNASIWTEYLRQLARDGVLLPRSTQEHNRRMKTTELDQYVTNRNNEFFSKQRYSEDFPF